MPGHPTVRVTEAGEYDDRQATAEAAGQQQETDGCYQLNVSLSLRVTAQSEEQYQKE